MSDIVERLREVSSITTGLLYSRRTMLKDAADRIDALEKALEPFATIAGAILAEAPADSDNYSLFMDCEGNAHRMTHDQLRAIRALITKEG